MSHFTKVEIRLKNERVLPIGSALIRWDERAAEFRGADGAPVRLGHSTAARALGKKPPGMGTMAKWVDEGVARSVLGRRVEPDGRDEHGSPSWLLALGLI